MTQPDEGKIVTFYSYKGGTGRTMALANIAWILAQAGKRVLAIDWDLESPGLHKFFHPFLDPEAVAATPGVIELITDYSLAATTPTKSPRGADWHLDYARVLPHAVSLDWRFPHGGELDFISAGRQNRDYSSLISSMDWDNFYERLGGGQFFDALREDMRRNYDYVLIDSRTGLSDIAEICTVQLPDVLVDCFTLSAQSIEGAAAVARHIADRYAGRGIRILPVPMRVENGENAKVEAGRAVARTEFDRFPRGLRRDEATAYWLAVEVPYRAFYAFEETLATFGDRPGAPGSMLAAFERLTAAITEGEVTTCRPIEESLRLATLERFTRRGPAEVTELLLSYVSEDRAWADWIAMVLDRAGFRVLKHSADTAAEGAIEQQSGGVGSTVVLLSPSYVQSRQGRAIWNIVSAAPALGGSRGLVPLRILDARLAGPFGSVPPVDLSGLGERQAADAVLHAVDRPGPAAEHPAELIPAGPRFPGGAANPAVWNVGTRNARFTGRGSVLERLRDEILGGSQAVVLPQALYGLGGVGKTQVALEYAHRFKADYDLVWWISAEQPDLINTALAELAARLGHPVGESVTEAAEAAREALRRGIPHARWLLIFDNASDPKEIEEYLPGGDGHVLITSRNQAWSRVAAPLEVDVFTSAESVEHLIRRVPGLTPEEALKVGSALGFLPLAVEQAAAWLEVTGVAADVYLTQLEQQTAEVLALEAPADYPAPVASTWTLSFQQLQQASPAAARMLELCAFFAPEPISLDMIYSDEMARLLARYDDTLREKLVLGKVVRELSRFALAKVDQGNNSLQVHRLVQAVIRSRMTLREQDETCHEVHTILAGAKPRQGDTDDPENWPKFDQILPHVGPSRAAACGEEETRQLLIDLVRYLWKRGDFERGLREGSTLSDGWAERLGPDHWQRLFLQSQLANVLRSQGRYEEACDLDQKVLARQRATLGDDHPHTLITAGGLSADLGALGRYQEALTMARETYDRLTELFGDDHPRTLASANNLALSYRLVGDCFSARDLDRDTLDRRRAVHGPDHPWTLFSAAALARDMREAGEYQTSVTLLRSTLRIYRDVLGEKALDTLRTATSLAASLRKAGHREEAQKLALDTHVLFNQMFPDSPDTVAAALELVSCQAAIGQQGEARDRATEILAERRKKFGPGHPYTLVVANNLANYLCACGDTQEGYELGTATLGRLRSGLGEQHPFTLSCAVNLANCLVELGRPAEAAALGQETLDLFRDRLGQAHADHPDALACRANLTIALLALDRTAEAAQVREGVVDAFRRVLGENHPNVRDAQEGVRLSLDLEPQPV